MNKDYILDAKTAIATVHERRTDWQVLPLKDKAALLKESLQRLRNVRGAYKEAAMVRRGYRTAGPRTPTEVAEQVAMEFISGLFLASWMSTLHEMLETVIQTGKYPSPKSISLNCDGTLNLNLGPTAWLDRVLSGMCSIELHVENPKGDAVIPDISEIQLQPGALLSRSDEEDAVVAVLGAGNYDAPIDILTALIIENRVVIYKPSPLFDAVLEPILEIFDPFLRSKFLVITKGGSEEGQLLLNDPRVTKWLMTGDVKTANKILFGSPHGLTELPSGELSATDIKNALKLDKPFSLELGNISPYIIAPGNWTASELSRHARHLAFWLLFNGGHICAHPQVIITCKNWSQRDLFFSLLKQQVEAAAVAGHFYPNADDSFKRFKKILKDEGTLDESRDIWRDGSFIFPTGVSITSALLKQESFCYIAGEVALDTEATISAFLPAAVTLCNDQVYGSLSVSIVAKCSDPDDSVCLNRAVTNIAYTSVGVNCCGLSTIFFPQLVWGGHRNVSSLTNLGSGIGYFGNCHGFKAPLKSVIRSSFIGPTHYVQAVFQGREAARIDVSVGRITSTLCSTNKRSWLISLTPDFIKIGSGLILGI